MPSSPFKKILQPKLVVGEGSEEVLFFESWLKHLEISDTQVVEYKGKSMLKPFLAALHRFPGFDRLETLAITRDADDDPVGAEQSVNAALADAGLPSHLRVEIYILPEKNKAGALENVCLETIREQPIETCIESYLRCAQQADLNYDWNIGDAAKSRIRAWLSVQAIPDLRLGEAACAGFLNWEAPCLDGLRVFLKSL